MTEQLTNNELQKMWKETVVALCKALACWKGGKPRTFQWVSRLRFKPATFQIKIQKANNCTPKHLVQYIKYEYKQMTILQSHPGYYVMLNSKQQYSASIFRVYKPLPELPDPEDDESISMFLYNTRINLQLYATITSQKTNRHQHCCKNVKFRFIYVITCEVLPQ
jgi:hypothetical protein